MEKLIRQFIIKTILFTAVIAAVCTVIFLFLLPDIYFSSFPFILLMFPVVSIIIHIRLLKSSRQSLAKFNIAFMLSFLIKLFVYLGVSAAVLSVEVENKVAFVITILIIYLLFTVFDVNRILKDMKKLDITDSENTEQ